MSRRVPVEVRTYRMPDGQPQRVPVAPLEALGSGVVGLQEAVQKLGEEYEAMLREARGVLEAFRSRPRRRADPRLYWDLGDVFFRFLERNRQGPVYLNGVLEHVRRDLGVSASLWGRVLRLRRLVPDRALLDPGRPVGYYLSASAVRPAAGLTARPARGRSRVAASVAAAVEFAVNRPGRRPRLADLLAAAAYVLDATQDPDAATAAVLYAAGIHGQRGWAEVEGRFGDRVANILAESSVEVGVGHAGDLKTCSPLALVVYGACAVWRARALLSGQARVKPAMVRELVRTGRRVASSLRARGYRSLADELEWVVLRLTRRLGLRKGV